MFEAKIKREGGLLTVTLTSEAMEQMMKSLASDKASTVNWSDGTVEGPGVTKQFENYHRWDVKMAKLSAATPGLRTDVGSALFSEDGASVNLIPLTLKGLGAGLVIKPSTPYPADHLKRWAKSLTEVANALLTSVQPVHITVSVRAAAAPEAAVVAAPGANRARR